MFVGRTVLVRMAMLMLGRAPVFGMSPVFAVPGHGMAADAGKKPQGQDARDDLRSHSLWYISGN
ncbi:MAG: hypothetical protein BGO69_06665 [Bacteroidetes bacterium 46-16]|nr:MAG: hypothetical protein BGO69_06665 [Bacteroidetes bacterium 46-16]